MLQIFTRNWAMKLACVALSILLWFLVVGEPQVVTVEAVPLSYGNLPAGMAVLSDPPDSIRLELQGASREIDHENLSGLRVLLDFSAVKDLGDRTFEIKSPQVNLPTGVTLLRAVPASVTVTFDRVESRQVPVDVRFKGKPADGYYVANKRVTPEQVRISGPASRLGQVSSSIAEVELGEQSSGFAVSVPASTTVTGVKLDSPASVRVEVAIEKGKSLQR